MKNLFTSFALTIVAILFTFNIAFAADTKSQVGKPAPKPTQETAKPVVKEATADTKVVKKEQVDINSASDAELKAIPGLGDALVAKIVVNRPYANKTQLKSRNVIPDSVYEKIKDLIIAKQPKKK